MMASCMTLKRSYDHDRESTSNNAYEPRPNPSAKRPRRHFPVTVVSSSNEIDETPITNSSVFPDIQPIVTADALLTRIKEEVRRLQRRQQFKSHQSSDTTDDETSHPSPPAATTDSSTTAQPLLTLKQVNLICSRLLKEREEIIREEYDRILSTKLNEQHENFVRFTQDQLTRRFSQLQFSYVS